MRKSAAILLAAAITAGSAGCGGKPGAPVSPGTTSSSATEPSGAGVPGTEAGAYLGALAPAMNALGAALVGIPTVCGPSNVPECRDALKKVHDANAALEKVRHVLPVLGGLCEADSEMHSSAELMDRAMHDWTNGMDAGNFTALAGLGREFDEASAHQTRAIDLLQHSSC